MEFVLVVKREELFPAGAAGSAAAPVAPHGLLVLDAEERRAVLARIAERGFFVERRHAERDPSLKQIIPYCVVLCGGRILATRRLPRGGETRLHGKRSVGIGGHVNPVDGAAEEGRPDGSADVLTAALARELEEELRFHAPWSARAVGLLNDDTTDVGSVHVGLVHVVETAVPPEIRETDVLAGEWLPPDAFAASVRADRGAWESWSAFLADRMVCGPDGAPEFLPPQTIGRSPADRAQPVATAAAGSNGANGAHVTATSRAEELLLALVARDAAASAARERASPTHS